MRSHRRPRVKVKARFSFFAVLAFVLCTDGEGTALMCLLACMLHELGHLAAMFAVHSPPESITLRGGGIRISGGGRDFRSEAGGCVMNLLLFLGFYFLPLGREDVRLFAVINLLLAAFNLLPLGSLDGKLLLDKALLRAFPAEKALRLSELTEKIMLALVLPAAILLVFSGRLSLSALIFFFYLLAVEKTDNGED